MWPKFAQKARARPAKSMEPILTLRPATESLGLVLVAAAGSAEDGAAVGRGFGLSSGTPPDSLLVGAPVSVSGAPPVPDASHIGIHMLVAASDATEMSSSEHVLKTHAVLIPWASAFVQTQTAGSLQVSSFQRPHQIEMDEEQ